METKAAKTITCIAEVNLTDAIKMAVMQVVILGICRELSATDVVVHQPYEQEIVVVEEAVEAGMEEVEEQQADMAVLAVAAVATAHQAWYPARRPR
jgi:hypothetical protein